MLSIFKRDEPSVGSILFRGNLAPRIEEFEFLRKDGIDLKPMKVGDFAHWGLAARHGEWGDAQIVCLKEAKVPADIIRFTPGLPDDEKTSAGESKVTVSVRIPAKQKTVLRDRKRMLRFGRAVMGDDGLVLLDHQSILGWGRDRLDDELMHDAELDISALYAAHAVTDSSAGAPTKDDGPTIWLHTHGLGELGAFDFDIMRPHEDLTSLRGDDLMRSMAFAILEGRVKPNEAKFELGEPGIHVRLVPAEEFMAKAPAPDRALRDDPHGAHTRKRSVLCDPGARSFFGLGGSVVRPSRVLMRELPEQGMFRFSEQATETMATRARQTVHLLPQILEDVAKFKPQAIAKIGYQTDTGGMGGKEHMWFEIHGVRDDGIDGTLQVKPFDIARMQMGQRGVHPIDQLTDWMIVVPFGTITPRNLRAWRMAKEGGAELMMLMSMLGGAGE